MLQWPLRAPVRFIARRVRRDPDLIAFGCVRNRFADNSAYLFLEMAADPRLRCVWITGSRRIVDDLRGSGYVALHRWSPRGLLAAARASWYVHSFAFSDVNLWLSDGAIGFNLWHGVGVKRIERSRGEPWSRMYAASDRSVLGRVFADDRRRPDWLLTTSAPMTARRTADFGIGPERCVQAGYPRNDHLVRRCRPPDALVDRDLYERLAAERIVVGYFPTWRYDSIAPVPEGYPDVDDLARVVAEQGGIVLFKAHHQSATPVASTPALAVLPSDADLNAYLGLCDVLITDYSSVAADYLLLDRPIIVFAPDLDARPQQRFSVDPATMQPGVVVRSADELHALLRDISAIPCADDFAALRSYFWGTPGAGASSALAAFIREHAHEPHRGAGRARRTGGT